MPEEISLKVIEMNTQLASKYNQIGCFDSHQNWLVNGEETIMLHKEF